MEYGKSIPKSEKHRVREEPGARRVRKLPESLGWSRTELGSGRRRVRLRACAAATTWAASLFPGGFHPTQSQSVISVSMVAKGRNPLLSATTALFAVSVYFRPKLQPPDSRKAVCALGPQSQKPPRTCLTCALGGQGYSLPPG